ncbi:hypothetical protein B0H14DRAFT_2988583 [Mycena olivaceomarginata]|nr:hypothetical protein B0H14DRAFT_2988583 [Mycena olivaceomarginata]
MMGLATNEEGPNTGQAADLHAMARGRQETATQFSTQRQRKQRYPIISQNRSEPVSGATNPSRSGRSARRNCGRDVGEVKMSQVEKEIRPYQDGQRKGYKRRETFVSNPPNIVPCVSRTYCRRYFSPSSRISGTTSSAIFFFCSSHSMWLEFPSSRTWWRRRPIYWTLSTKSTCCPIASSTWKCGSGCRVNLTKSTLRAKLLEVELGHPAKEYLHIVGGLSADIERCKREVKQIQIDILVSGFRMSPTELNFCSDRSGERAPSAV